MDPATNKNGSWPEAASTPKFGSVRPPGGKEGGDYGPRSKQKRLLVGDQKPFLVW